MKATLITPKSSFQKQGKYTVSSSEGRIWQPFDQAFIGTILEENKVDVEIIDAVALNLGLEEIKERLAKNKPDFVAISTTTVDMWRCPPLGYENVSQVLNIIPDGIQKIVYGPHVSVFPERIFAELNPDYIVLGEPEERIPNIILKGDSDGIVYKEDTEIVKKPQASPVDMSKLPVPAYHLLPMERYHSDSSYPTLQNMPFVYTITARGCPLGCTFCSKTIVTSKFRSRSFDILEDEFEALEKKFHVKSIYFGDEIFGFYEKRFVELCELLSNYNFKFGCQFRADTPYKLDILKKAGCVMVDIGVESFDENVLKNIRKGVTAEKCKKTIREIKAIGIPVRLFMILGLPGETKESIEKSLKEYGAISPVAGGFPVATIFPNTQLWDEAIKEGKIKGESWQEVIPISGTVGNSFKREEIEKIYEDVTAETINYWSLIKNTSKIKLIRGAMRNPVFAAKILGGMFKNWRKLALGDSGTKYI